MKDSKYLDNETQLYYYGHRYYNPEAGKWICRDRDWIMEDGGFNLYAFVENMPIHHHDLLGLKLDIIKTTKTCTDISLGNVRDRAIKQIRNNPKIKKYLEHIINSRKCKKLTLDDFLNDPGSITIPIHVTDAPWHKGSGICHYNSPFTNNGWGGKVPNKTIGLDADDLFQSDCLDSDKTDEEDAAETLIHEVTHWITAYCRGTVTGPDWKGTDDEKAYDEGKKVADMIDWDFNTDPKPSKPSTSPSNPSGGLGPSICSSYCSN